MSYLCRTRDHFPIAKRRDNSKREILLFLLFFLPSSLMKFTRCSKLLITRYLEEIFDPFIENYLTFASCHRSNYRDIYGEESDISLSKDFVEGKERKGHPSIVRRVHRISSPSVSL